MLDAAQMTLPTAPGVGFKAQHFSDVTTAPGPVKWLEVHAENYLGDGGRPIAQLRALSEQFPISAHGVGLSIGSEQGLDAEHLARLNALVSWLNPASFSEHLAWSTHDTAFLNDLLPLPYTEATLARVARHIDQVQETIGRRMLLENPSTYLAFAESDMSETDFLRELTQRTGCGLLLDINNVFVSATNQQTDARAYLADFPMEAVGELHLGGHDEDEDEHGVPLLIDSHGAPVVDPVWTLYAEVIAAYGALPTLIEWDTDVPDWTTLRSEAERAATILDAEAAQAGSKVWA